MKIKIIIFITSLLFNFAFGQNGSISGKIIDEKNLPLASAVIFVDGPRLTTLSDNEGNFSFSELPFGNYRLTFSLLGRKPETRDVEITRENIFMFVTLKESNIRLGEVTVTSPRYEVLEKDVALPLEIVREDHINRLPSIGIADALQNEPGLTLVRDGIWGTDVNIRGLSRQNVVILVDGNRIETSTNHAAGLSLIDIFNVSRVEVIKGGVSSLYGTGATGGVINVFTKGNVYTPNFKLSGSLISGFNSVNSGGLGYLSLAASSGFFNANISGTLRNAENTKTPSGTLENSYFKDNSLSASLGIKPFWNHELKFNFQRFHGTDIGIPGAKSFPSAAVAKYILAERNLYSGEYHIRHLIQPLNDLSIKYFYQLIQRDVELRPNANTVITPGADHTTQGVSLQTDWLLSDFNRAIAGIDIWQREYNGHRETKLISSSRITGDFPVPNSRQRSIGLFIQDELRFFDDKLHMSLGGRIDQINVENDETKNPSYIIINGIKNENPPVNAQSSFSAGTYDDISWSTNIGSLYSLLNELDITFNFAHSFRSPSLEERFQYINLLGNVYLGDPLLKPEQGNFADIGIRFHAQSFFLKANLFLNTFNELVVDKEVITDSLYIKSNVGKSALYGFDLSSEYTFDENQIYLSASYVIGKDISNDSYLPQIPPFYSRGGIKSSLLKYILIELAASIFSGQNKTAIGEISTPGYFLLDTYISSLPIELGYLHIRMFGGVENILNKSYRNHLSTLRGQIKSEPGRNIFIKINVNW